MDQRKRFAAGERIFDEGEFGDRAYFIEKGTVEISRRIGGRKKVIDHVLAGDVFGEMALINDDLRSAAAIAVEDTEVLVLARDYVKTKLAQTDALVGLLLQVLLARLRAARGYAHAPADVSPDDQAAPYVRQRDSAMGRLRSEQRLSRAIEHDEFELYYQPIVDLNTRGTAGFEALIRWHQPGHPLRGPNEFVGLAEESGLIVPIGRWILEQACTALQQLEASRADARTRPLKMSVNVSAPQFTDSDLAHTVSQIVEATGVDASQLRIEITESVLIDDPERAARTLECMKDLGASVAIDDFGTGYSSLGYLLRFPIDAVKIDQSFVRSMLDNRKSMQIVRATAELARSLEMASVAEGIDGADELRELIKLGVQFGQGYFFSKPVPLSEAKALVRQSFSW